ncbi:hypothetical protein, partial [Escherichia coli]|uniref:hypothetical protein n=1 Tax=Escherichia coli TaxID=562 RepID=UPI001BC84E43
GSLGFQRVNLPAFTIESDKPEIVRASFKISATFQMPSAFSRPDGTVTLFNNLSDNLCGHSKIRILNVARRKMNTKSQE